MANDQIYWDDVNEGQEMPPLEKIADRLMLVKWAGASGDFIASRSALAAPRRTAAPTCTASAPTRTSTPRAGR